ncbi:MAG: hypothetical protein B7C24_04960 [Bacteroidetes bacterium 4572_77]|nr:MAG: hypothetical protein B7C24_04960 [Bacteroidetes bacterium 4572_77]
MSPIQLSTIAHENQGNSYITFPTDLGNIEPIWFEANLIPNFNIRASKNSRLLGVLTPQIIIRMYQEESFPVRTPSYIPQLSVYYRLGQKDYANTWNLFGRFAHHSNGQDGDFYLENGDINLKTGSFATNYLEFGIIKTQYSERYNAVQFFSTSIEVHPPNMSIDELKGIYGLYRWNTIFSIFKLQNTSINGSKKASLSLKAKATWMFGELNDKNALAWRRLIVSMTLYYHPKFLEDIGFFAQVYRGSDYYNIYFDHQLLVIRFGIMTEILRF